MKIEIITTITTLVDVETLAPTHAVAIDESNAWALKLIERGLA